MGAPLVVRAPGIEGAFRVYRERELHHALLSWRFAVWADIRPSRRSNPQLSTGNTFMTFARHSLALAGAALALAAGSTPVLAADQAPMATAPAAESTAQTLRAVRDKETGKLRAPTQDELKELVDAERASRKARGQAEPSGAKTPLAVRQHASGMKSAVLGPDFLATLKAERAPDGRLIVRHADAAHDHVQSPSKLPTE
jgi:hypothetical protein